ncbi:hypothetical protein [Knoellia sp. p5-6-4]|uniref:hypothetical protein n=1 Tax=unclassified Knoellia TaxID=2618719 RepID=UPI0023DB2DF2|nr:hypothetical protein [Knoellia sp. p5-6-4]MDF2145511.1 hypothetical protein [Knoellia sp. p5-6-4]
MTLGSDLTRELTTGTYEITVAGSLGPVLRAALQPLVTTASGPCTTLRAALRRRDDIADLVALLDAKGLEVTHISLDGPSAGRVAAHRTSPPITAHQDRVTRARGARRALKRWQATGR